MGTPVFLGKVAVAASSSGVALTIGAGVSAGSTIYLLYFGVGGAGASTATDTGGNTYTEQVHLTQTDNNLRALTAPCTVALSIGNTITMGNPSGSPDQILYAYAVPEFSNTIDVSGSVGASGSSGPSYTSGPLSASNELVFGFASLVPSLAGSITPEGGVWAGNGPIESAPSSGFIANVEWTIPSSSSAVTYAPGLSSPAAFYMTGLVTFRAIFIPPTGTITITGEAPTTNVTVPPVGAIAITGPAVSIKGPPRKSQGQIIG